MNIDKTASSKAINIPARPESTITGKSILENLAAARAARNPSSPVQSALSPKIVATANAQANTLPKGKQAAAQKIIDALEKMKQPTNTTANY